VNSIGVLRYPFYDQTKEVHVPRTKGQTVTDSSLPGRQQITASLADARQTLALMKSQLNAGLIAQEQDFWSGQLENLSDLLEIIAVERTNDQQSRLAALYQVSRVIGASLDTGEVLNQVMDAIIKLTGAERGFLMLLDENHELEVKAARDLAQETLSKEEFAFSRSVIRQVAETGEQVVTNNASNDPRFSGQDSVVVHQLRSIQCVPLRARGSIIGVIYVDNPLRSGVFDEADLEMLAAFSAQAAVAIENARLFTMTDEALARRVEELSMMQEIDRQLNETLDFGKVMDLTLQWAMRVADADNGAIGLLEMEGEQNRIVAQHGEELSKVKMLLSNGKKPKGDGVLTAPIQREGRVIGVIALDRADGKSFSPEARDFVTRLADHAAIAIENARLYQAVKRANEAKTEFVSLVTHELRIPMTSIKGYAEMLKMMGGLTEQQEGFIEIIRNNVGRMSKLTSDLSDISRIETGRLNLEVEDNIEIRQVLDEILTEMKAEIESREHTLVRDIPSRLPRVRVDPNRLGQVLTNLINNAAKYTTDGGTITIRARKAGDFVRCEVADTGVGMTPEELKNLFVKFWRSENAFIREQVGTGLGLAIAKNLVELQGGQMSVESEVGVGTTIAFTMPISVPPVEELRAANPEGDD
jgi:signal transduction histidine kinase